MVRLLLIPRMVLCSSLSLTVAACGSFVPSIITNNDQDPDGTQVNSIMGNIKAQLRCAIWHTIDEDLANAKVNGKRRLKWLDTSVALITVKLTVDEKSSLSPASVSTHGVFSLGLGATASTDASHIESIDYTLSVQDDIIAKRSLLNEHPEVCNPFSGPYLHGDLLLSKWMERFTFPYLVTDPINNNNVQDVFPANFTTDIQFTIAASGSLGPAWKFQNISVNQGGALFAVTHSHVNEIILTIGPSSGNPKSPSPGTAVAHNIAKQGSANQPKS